MFRAYFRTVLIALVSALFVSAVVWGQGYEATFKGLVTDVSGAVIPGATVTVRDLDTNEVAETVTNIKGAYKLRFPHPAHRLEVSAQDHGFKNWVSSPIALTASGTQTLNIVLEVGTTTEPDSAHTNESNSAQSASSTYTREEYNAYVAAANEKDAQQRIALLDAFVAKFPNSTLAPYIYDLYYIAYNDLKNYPKSFEYADKLISLNVSIDSYTRFRALFARCRFFPYYGFDRDAPDAHEQLVRQRDYALEGVRLAEQLSKPSELTMSEEEFRRALQDAQAHFYQFAGAADLALRDFAAAKDALKSSLAENPADPRANYLLGSVYIAQTPPQFSDGIWLMARAVVLKDPGEPQIRDYLHKAIMAHQNATCDSFVDKEVNDVIRLAANSAEPPIGFTIATEVSQQDQSQCAAESSARSEVAGVSGNPSQPQGRGFARDEGSEAQPAVEQTGRYFALVIGIDDYRFVTKLKTAVNDAQSIAKILREQYGFETKVLLNATREQIIRALSEYRRTLDQNANLLIYYAGHGVYVKDANKTYWLAVDGEPVDMDGNPVDTTNWIIADEITTDINVIPARHILIISDSCYSGGITRSVNVDLTPQEGDRYLRKMMAGKSRTLMASGGLEPVSDQGGVGHSVFADALIRGLTTETDPAFSAENLFYEFIRMSVAGRSNQTPEYDVIHNSGHDSGDFVFIRVK